MRGDAEDQTGISEHSREHFRTGGNDHTVAAIDVGCYITRVFPGVSMHIYAVSALMSVIMICQDSPVRSWTKQ